MTTGALLTEKLGANSGDWQCRTASVLLLIFAFCIFYKNAWGNMALGAILILTLLDARRVHTLLSELAWYRLTIAFIGFLLMSALLTSLRGPLEGQPVAEVMLDHLKVGFLPGLIIGYWLYRRPQLLPAMLWIIPLGMILRVATKADLADFQELLQGADRATFGDGAVLLGLWCVVIVIISLHLLTDAVFALAEPGRRLEVTWMRIGAASAYAAFGAVMLAFTQTRTAWLIAIAVIPPFLVGSYLARCGAQGPSVPRRLAVPLIGGVAVTLVALIWTFSGPLVERVKGLNQPIAPILAGDWSAVTDNSVLYRLQMLDEAFGAWAERPIAGWGAGADEVILANSKYEALVRHGFYHFHNDMALFLAEYGTLGAIFFLTMFLIPAWYLARTLFSSRQLRPLAITTAALLIAFALATLTDRVVTSTRGPYVLAFISGATLAMYLQMRHTEPPSAH